MTEKQKNIVRFIEKNTEYKLDNNNNVSSFIGKHWGEAKGVYGRKKVIRNRTSNYRASNYDVSLHNFAGDNGINEYEAESILGTNDSMMSIYSTDDM